MRILLVTPPQQTRLAGNQITARRWTKIFRTLGHDVIVSDRFDDQPVDLLLAIHAYRSADSIERFSQDRPDDPLVVALTGTDIYRFLASDPERTTRSLALADRLVVLNALAPRVLPEQTRSKAFLVYEGADPLPRRRRPSRRCFEVCVIGHLREEKDPLLTAQAVRALPEASTIRVDHYGGAYGDRWAVQARTEMTQNSRYQWHGSVPHWRVRRALGRCHVQVLSSRMEGGPNVLSEAIVAGVPILSTDIDGAVGVLGDDYDGFFPVGDAEELRRRLLRMECEPGYVQRLTDQIAALAPTFTVSAETRRWKTLLDEAAQGFPNT